MEITPKLLSTRFAQLKAGDLYLYQHDGGQSVALKTIDPALDGDPCELALGPTFPRGTVGPHLLKASVGSVVSFGTSYRLILPVVPTAWHDNPPPPECHCVAVNEQTAYFRANWADSPGKFRACYIDIQTGKVHATTFGTGSYAEPPGIKAYASEWKLALPGDEGAIIHSYKWAGPVSDGGS